jgi:hypothetical protein
MGLEFSTEMLHLADDVIEWGADSLSGKSLQCASAAPMLACE